MGRYNSELVSDNDFVKVCLVIIALLLGMGEQDETKFSGAGTTAIRMNAPKFTRKFSSRFPNIHFRTSDSSHRNHFIGNYENRNGVT
jgi:hypothetical protein